MKNPSCWLYWVYLIKHTGSWNGTPLHCNVIQSYSKTNYYKDASVPWSRQVQKDLPQTCEVQVLQKSYWPGHGLLKLITLFMVIGHCLVLS